MLYLDHVTLAVRDLSSAAACLCDALGLIVEPDGSTRLGSGVLQLRESSTHQPGWLGYVLGADAELADVADGGGALPTLIRRARPARATADHPLGVIGVSAVGVAVRDLSTWEATFSHLLQREPMHDSVAFVRAHRANWLLDDGCLVRLLAPEDPALGAVAEHLAQRGEGLFIIRLGVRDLAHACAELERRGTRVSERQPDGTVFVVDASQTLHAPFALDEQAEV